MNARFLLLPVIVWAARSLAGAEFTSADLEFFEKKIRPVLAEHCYKCHSADAKKLKGDLMLDHRAGVFKGGDTGSAIVSGKPEQSLLIEAIEYDNVDLEMPPRGKLSDQQIADFTEWVKRGAPWPKEAAVGPGSREQFDLAKRKAEHWSWQPVQAGAPPKVKQAGWPTSPIDHFILAKLEAAGLKPAGPADKRALIRRAYFDLIGLPPTPAQVEAFVADNSPKAFEKVVDELLAAPQYGERWARHWLDLMRYAETFGHEFDYMNQEVWRYRDYVIRAFNDDVPYDRFVKEHIAGDLLKPRFAKDGGWNESRLATSWWWLGQHCHSPVDVRAYQAEIIDNQIDVLGKAFQGMTIACARCHDHKFDAISTKDYYALYGMIGSGSFSHGAVDGPNKFAELQKGLVDLKQKIQSIQPKTAEAASAPAAETNEKYQLISDIRKTQGHDWFADGAAWADSLTDADDFTVNAKVARRALPGWLHSGLLSRKLQGTLRSPTFTLSENHVHLLTYGRDVRINLVVDNFKIIKNPIYGGLTRNLNNEEPHWEVFNVSMWKGHQAYIEIADLTNSDPAGRGSGPDGYAAVQQLWISAEGRPPAGTLTKRPAETPLAVEALPHGAAYQKLADTVARPTVVPIMLEGTALNEKVFIRGSHKNLGEEVPRRFLTAFDNAKPAGADQTGRFALATHIADPENPLTSRVYANRIWHHLLGRGIVPSTDNFGVLGEAPTHPELLDWLANYLVQKGWSTKEMIRAVMLSQTYRMTSRPSGAATEVKDPTNQLLHRMRVRRLQGEAIRDAILAVSGRLDSRMFGPPVAVHLTSFMEGRGRPRSGPLDGAGRRTLYQEVRRNFLSPMMLAFDMPQPLSTFGRRTDSNVPAQALIMMNDPFVVEQAKLWGKRMLAAGPDDAARVRAAYALAFSREPSDTEQVTASAFLTAQAKAHGEAQPGEKAWADFCHALLNVKEFVFLN